MLLWSITTTYVVVIVLCVVCTGFTRWQAASCVAAGRHDKGLLRGQICSMVSDPAFTITPPVTCLCQCALHAAAVPCACMQ
jgi:hypothetical protein